MASTMYTVVSERCSGSGLNRWMAKTSQYDAYRGHFGYRGEPVIYHTTDGNAFCVIVQPETQLTGWFEDHDRNLVQPAIAAIAN